MLRPLLRVARRGARRHRHGLRLRLPRCRPCLRLDASALSLLPPLTLRTHRSLRLGLGLPQAERGRFGGVAALVGQPG